MDDLRSVFGDKYLHCVDSDKVLVCETYKIATKTASILEDGELPFPNSSSVYDNLEEDGFTNNISVTLFNDDGSEHKMTLKTKITRNVTLDSIKEKLRETKENGKNLLTN